VNQQELRLSVIEQMHPQRVGYGRDGLMCAIVACILGQAWTEPSISDLKVTSDGFVLACVDGGLANDFIGAFSELSRNWQRLCEHAELTPCERRMAGELFRRATGRRMIGGKVPARARP
jgi:hypothetical protein